MFKEYIPTRGKSTLIDHISCGNNKPNFRVNFKGFCQYLFTYFRSMGFIFSCIFIQFSPVVYISESHKGYFWSIVLSSFKVIGFSVGVITSINAINIISIRSKSCQGNTHDISWFKRNKYFFNSICKVISCWSSHRIVFKIYIRC